MLSITKPRPDPIITVAVITWNRAAFLNDCLAHLVKQNFLKESYEIVVVDDGSTDDTSSVVKSWQEKVGLPALHYVKQIHRGVNAARNSGINRATGRVVLFLDDDELAPHDFLARVERLFEDNPRFDGIGGPVRDYGNTTSRTCVKCSLANVDVPGEGKRLVPRLLGGNMALRAAVFKKVGLFDETISGRGDETEWFHRAKDLQFFYDPDLWVWHRRDNFDFTMLCRHAFVQGLSIPLAMKKQGIDYHPRPTRIVRSLIHAIRFRCVKGVVLALRELGAISGYLKRAN